MNPAEWFFVLCGLACLVLAWFSLLKILRMRTWRSTPAEICGLDIRWEAADGAACRSMKVSYRYEANGQTYSSNRITVSDFLFASGELQIRYLARKHILPGPKAYYDPRNPKESVLVRPGFSLPAIHLCMAAAFFAILLLRGK